ncbi:DoxX family membrane protein [Actinoplanes sp. TBRC 11911]|uniref:DoxX family membrane protein n=1 Tax=Actinoplanes sp. TBRC 11911 TaxID=2729386 RepID=UPI00145DDADE|nr:DoxX family membrane protein [Actinoplanes sp. TBRC 11911]NMO54442.1 DoxX family membrane protein [Actinoplanes sp. TBRC 11911]
MKPVRSAARAMLASIFVVNGVRDLIRPDAKVETARPVTDRLTPLLERLDPRIPTDPKTLVRIKAAADVLAGAALATGRVTRPAAAVLAAGLVPSTLVRNPKNDGGDYLKNVGLLGGLLLAAVDTEGRPGVGYRTSHAVDRSQRTVKRAVRTAKREASRRLPKAG